MTGFASNNILIGESLKIKQSELKSETAGTAKANTDSNNEYISLYNYNYNAATTDKNIFKPNNIEYDPDSEKASWFLNVPLSINNLINTGLNTIADIYLSMPNGNPVYFSDVCSYTYMGEISSKIDSQTTVTEIGKISESRTLTDYKLNIGAIPSAYNSADYKPNKLPSIISSDSDGLFDSDFRSLSSIISANYLTTGNLSKNTLFGLFYNHLPLRRSVRICLAINENCSVK